MEYIVVTVARNINCTSDSIIVDSLSHQTTSDQKAACIAKDIVMLNT